jgi:tetratricopeptide (TPR) repeat protein
MPSLIDLTRGSRPTENRFETIGDRMSNSLTFRRNTFQETLLGLEYSATAAHHADIFSRACVETYAEADWAQFGYPFTQIFEPGVLQEVALLEGVPYDSLTNLSHRPSVTINYLAEMVNTAAEFPTVGLLNLASALVSISRFEMASRLVEVAAAKVSSPREQFEVGWLEFLISNRRDDGANSPRAFERMRQAVETGGIPRGRVLDVCTQGVVWYVKRREIPEDVFRWCVAVGGTLAKTPGSLDLGTVSSWYRGRAMIPAAKRDADKTREYMERAHDAAREQVSTSSRAYEMNSIKTYYESTMKEHMYVTGDFESAEEAGRALISLDPAWAPSYGELAEAYQKFGKPEQAAELYEKAAAAGPPYMGYHLLQAARCRARLKNDTAALAHYLTLAGIARESELVHKEGLEVARRVSHESSSYFESALKRIGEGA